MVHKALQGSTLSVYNHYCYVTDIKLDEDSFNHHPVLFGNPHSEKTQMNFLTSPTWVEGLEDAVKNTDHYSAHSGLTHPKLANGNLGLQNSSGCSYSLKHSHRLTYFIYSHSNMELLHASAKPHLSSTV